MATAARIPAHPFSEAKTRLSELMNEVVHRHRPQLVERHGGKESMLLLPTDDMQVLLTPFRFEAEVHFSKREVTAVLPRFGLIGVGRSLEAALDDLLDVLRDFVTLFIERWDFYRHTNQAELLPWVLRFALTPPERQHDLLTEEA